MATEDEGFLDSLTGAASDAYDTASGLYTQASNFFDGINNSNSATGGGGNTSSGGQQAADCNVVQGLLSGNKSDGDQSLFGRAKDMFGSSVGQAAFKFVSGNIPKIEVSNNTNKYIRSLADAVNSGAQSFAGNTTNSVVGTIFEGVGINPNLVPSNANDETIFNNGTSAAGFIADKLIGGTIDALDLPAPIGALASMAFVQQTQAQKGSTDITDPGCGISPYAQDLIAYAPKHNFMFMVQFEFQPDYNKLNKQGSTQNKLDDVETIKFHYLCREMERPTIEVDYEDVNMYNIRTKVAKKVVYNPISMKLVDDQKNSTMVFLEKYLKIRSPLANQDPILSDTMEKAGMNFDTWNANKDTVGSASMGGLRGPNKSVLRRVVVYHIFGYGSRVNRYTYVNPKILEFNLSDFSMDNHDPASVDIQMSYDSVFMETDLSEDVIGTTQLRERSQLGTQQILKHSG